MSEYLKNPESQTETIETKNKKLLTEILSRIEKAVDQSNPDEVKLLQSTKKSFEDFLIDYENFGKNKKTHTLRILQGKNEGTGENQRFIKASADLADKILLALDAIRHNETIVATGKFVNGMKMEYLGDNVPFEHGGPNASFSAKFSDQDAYRGTRYGYEAFENLKTFDPRLTLHCRLGANGAEITGTLDNSTETK